MMILGMFSWVLIAGCQEEEKIPNASQESIVEKSDLRQKVQVQKVEQKEFSDIYELEAKLEAIQTAVLVPKSAGRVQEVWVRIGDVVQEGDKLLSVEEHDYRLGYKEAKANFELVQTQERHADAQKERFSILHVEGAATKAQLEEVEMGLSLAQSQLQRAHVGLQVAQSRLDGCHVEAPFSGVVIARNIEKGEMIGGPAQRPPLLIADISTLRVVADLDEQVAKKFVVGDQARIVAHNQEYTVSITRMNGAVDPVIHTVRIEAELSNDQGLLRHGEAAKMSLQTAQTSLLSMPRSALLGAKGGTGTVFVLKEDGTIEEKEIQYGASTDLFIPVLSGLEEGESVLISGHTRLKNGDSVFVVPN